MKNLITNFFRQTKETGKYFGWFTLTLIPILVVLNWSLLSTLNAQSESIISNEISSASQEIDMIDFYISGALNTTHNDVNVIRDSEEANTFLLDDSSDNLESFKQLVYRIANNKPQFTRVSLANSLGDELFKVSRLNDELIIENDFFLTNILEESYFLNVRSENEQGIYIEPLYSEAGQPTLTMVAPMIKDGHIDYYIILDYNANHFLSVFEQYLNNSNIYYTLGLINNDVIWKIEDSNQIFFELNDQERINRIKNDIENSEYSQLVSVRIDDSLSDFSNIDDGFFQIYSITDIDMAINNSSFILLRFPWLLIIFNFLVLVFFAYMGYFIKSKSENRILLNANMYLSDKNQDGVIITDEHWRIQYVNEAFKHFYGYSLEEMINQYPNEIIGLLGMDVNYRQINKGTIFEGNVWNRTKEGIRILKYLRVRHELTPRGKIKHFLGIHSEPEIELDNFNNFYKMKSLIIDDLARVLKLNQFIINQSCLMMIKLKNASTRDFALYIEKRLDSRYLIYIPKANYLMIYVNIEKYHFNQMIDLIDQIIESYRHHLSSDRNFSHQFVIAMSNEETESIEDLLDSLLIVLEYSDQKTQLRHLIYNQDMRKIIQRENDIKNELESAFAIDEFFLVYQVQQNLQTGKCSGVEALLRWENQKLGSVGPNEFIPIIEKSFYVNQLSIMVIQKIIDDFTPYINDLPEGFRLSLNLTNFDFSNDYIMDNILHIIKDSIIPTRYFNFEITESNYLENIEKTNRIIELLHDKNITISIDDFGTGFSSINSLKSIKVDMVKIDKIFIENYPENDNGDMFAIIADLIKSIDKKIVVEGTETKAQIEFSKQNKCHIAQGFYISRPIPIKAFIDRFISKTNDKNGDK